MRFASSLIPARAVMLFVIQIGSAQRVPLARDTDPAYGKAFDRARQAGVEAMAWKCVLAHDGIAIEVPVPVAG